MTIHVKYPYAGVTAFFSFRRYDDLVVDSVRLGSLESKEKGRGQNVFVENAPLTSLLRALVEVLNKPSMFGHELLAMTDEGFQHNIEASEIPDYFPDFPSSRLLPVLGLFFSSVIDELEKPGFDAGSAASLLRILDSSIRDCIMEEREQLVYYLCDWSNSLINVSVNDDAFTWEKPTLLYHLTQNSVLCEIVPGKGPRSEEIYIRTEMVMDGSVHIHISPLNMELERFSLTELGAVGKLNLNPVVTPDLEEMFALPCMAGFRMVSQAVQEGSLMLFFDPNWFSTLDGIRIGTCELGDDLFKTTVELRLRYGVFPVLYHGGDNDPVFSLRG